MSGAQKCKVQKALEKDQKIVSGLQSFLKRAKFDHVPGEQSADGSVTRTSELSLVSEDVDLGLSGLLGPGV